MKTFKIILLSLIGLIILAVIAGLVLINSIKHGAIPKYSGEQIIAGLTKQVTVYRDERGMPHIYADNEHDLYLAVGYIMAQERLWQMDLIRRATTGRLSEIFGESYVKTDMFLRSLDMTTKSKKNLSEEDSTTLNCMQAFADGVNTYINVAVKKLPPEFRILRYKPDQWKLEDIANIIGYMGWDLASDNMLTDISCYRLSKKFGTDKLSHLIPDWKCDSSYVFPSFSLNDTTLKEVEEFISSLEKVKALGITVFSGSNNWAVAGRRTETGKPILSNDMHLAFGSPGIWIQMHQVIPGKLNVTGVVVPGEPMVVAGHNERIAWGMTNLMVDDIDLFTEKINPADSNQYFFNDEWKNMKVRDEIIKIKGGKQQTLKLRFTHRGPVISGLQNINDAVISMHWAGYDPSNELNAVYKLNRAANWEDFREAVSNFRSISQNFVYADIDGNIGLNTGGGIAIRKGDGNIIRDGKTDEYDWKSYVPFEQLPYSYNPPEGYVSSANNKTVNEKYPYYISSNFILPYRINRIRQMLNEKEVFGIDDFKRMINDQHSNYAALLTPYILKLKNKTNELSQSETAALNTLSDWDYDMSEGLVAPSIFEFFRMSFIKNLLSDDFGEMYDQLTGNEKEYYIYRILKTGPDEWVDDATTPQKESLEDIILKTFKDCIADIITQYGADMSKWKWGNIHKIIIEHPMGSVKLIDQIFRFNSKAYSIGGSDHTVSPYQYRAGFKIFHGASERHIFNTANWDESLTVIPTGASGIPASEFYLSQTKTYLEGGFYKDAFSENAVKASARYTLVLKPEK